MPVAMECTALLDIYTFSTFALKRFVTIYALPLL